MSDVDYVLLEWSYTPTDFFEEPVYQWREDCEIHIEGGCVTATVDPDAYDAEHRKRDELHEVVDGYFRAVQIVTHKKYDLSKAGMSRVYPDGRRGASIFAEPAVIRFSGGSVDFMERDAAGNVVVDTKRERMEHERALGGAFARLRPVNPLLRKLLDSYQVAVADPDDELVHLYEIRDALGAHFGSASAAQKALGIKKAEWGLLGRLACAEPVQQGRHRGEHLVPLRKATADELREARALARGLIEAYARWADRSPDE